MTLKEENIVNIALLAGELLKEGKIERPEITGHSGFIQSIITMAEAFEEKNAGVDYDAEGRDYWLEIDAFAEDELLKEFGVTPEKETVPLDIKVIVDSGIVDSVLKNQNTPVNVEVLDIDPDYEDFKELDAYRDSLYKNPVYMDCAYTVAHFDKEDIAVSFENSDPVKIYAVSGSVKREIYSGDWDACTAFWEENNGRYVDENCFEWNLELVDEREASFPEGYFDAVDHFCALAGKDIETEFIRQHPKELVFCWENGLFMLDFETWTGFETLLDEELTFEEVSIFIKDMNCNFRNLSKDDTTSIQALKSALADFRNSKAERHLPLDSLIDSASQRVTGQFSDAPEKGISR